MMNTRHLLALVAISATAACKQDQPAADYQTPGAPAAPMPVKFSLADFQHLRYLEGTWRGTMPDGKPFYESYRFVNDSTILQGGHPDSTFATKTDSSRFEFRGGEVIHGSGTTYHAAELDSTTVDFRADVDPKTHFVWTREGADAWTARLFRAGPDGAEQVTVYPMQRIRR
ncbi:MAG: hypothetical protein ABIR92_01145 [Gemmatimonadaceae bacterium]